MPQAPLIAISGRVGSGKTTLIKYLSADGFEVFQVSIAETLKDEVCQRFPLEPLWLVENKNIARPLLIAWAELRRHFDPDHWVNLAIERIRWEQHAIKRVDERQVSTLLNPLIVIDDLRYPNEAERLKDEGAILVRLDCPESDSVQYMVSMGLDEYSAEVAARSSGETALADYDGFDVRLFAPRERALDEIYRDLRSWLVAKGIR